MIWQDAVMTVGQFLFFVALIPTIKAVEKPALGTGILTSVILTIYIPTLWSLSLYTTVATTVLVALGWWIITIQTYRKKRTERENF